MSFSRSPSSGSRATCTNGGPIWLVVHQWKSGWSLSLELEGGAQELQHARTTTISKGLSRCDPVHGERLHQQKLSRPRPRLAVSPRLIYFPWSGRRSTLRAREGRVSLETVIRGCALERLLDIVEHFIVFQELPGGLKARCARKPSIPWRQQGHCSVADEVRARQRSRRTGSAGASSTLPTLRPQKRREVRGVLGTRSVPENGVWRSSFTQKVLRTMPGNRTFVVARSRRPWTTRSTRNLRRRVS